MSNNTGSVPEALAEILGVAMEYDLHLEPNKFVNYVDLYRTYLSTCRDITNRDITTGATPDTASFYQFICSQTLLDSATSAVEIETGELMIAPQAFQPQYTWKTNANLTLPFGAVH